MLRKLLLLLVAITPSNACRIFLYRSLFGYGISYDSSIGPFNLLSLAVCEISRGHIGMLNSIRAGVLKMDEGSRIVKFNRFNDVNIVSLAARSVMLSRNTVVGSRPGLSPFKEGENFFLGEESIVTVGHLFDVSESIAIGKNVTIGGRGTEFWTHGFDLDHTKIQAPVTLENDVYVGSGCKVIQGVTIIGRVSIGAGTVVAKSISEPGFYISSQLVRKADIADYSQHKDIVEHNDARFVRK